MRAHEVVVREVAVKVVPKVDGRFGGGMATPGLPWLRGSIDAQAESGKLNKAAAAWTAVSVVLSAASALVGAFPN